MNELVLELQDAIRDCRDGDFNAIAIRFDVPLRWVYEANEAMTEDVDLDYDDGMDGDAASALASAGWGTDEDYVCDNDYFDDY